MSSSRGVKTTEVQSGYRTLQGQLYEAGTGTISRLILEAKDGNRYWVVTKSRQKKQSLRQLKGLSILLTGKVTAQEKSGQIKGTKSIITCQGQLELMTYNLVYDLSAEQTTILGQLVSAGEQLVVVTKEQYIVELAPDTYSSLSQYEGEKIVVKGKIEQVTDYRYQMKVSGVRTFK